MIRVRVCTYVSKKLNVKSLEFLSFKTLTSFPDSFIKEQKLQF